MEGKEVENEEPRSPLGGPPPPTDDALPPQSFCFPSTFGRLMPYETQKSSIEFTVTSITRLSFSVSRRRDFC